MNDKPSFVLIAEVMERNARRMSDYSKVTNPKGDDDLLGTGAGIGKVHMASAQSGERPDPAKDDPNAPPMGVSVENNPDVPNPVPEEKPEPTNAGDGTGDGVPASPNAG